MKESTRRTIKWLIDHLNHYRINLARGKTGLGLIAGEQEDKNSLLAIELLRNLPILENSLRKGGYIQDKNGKPCCDGDEVVFSYIADCINVPTKKGQLRWSPAYNQFVILANNHDYDFDDVTEFEKVEK